MLERILNQEKKIFTGPIPTGTTTHSRGWNIQYQSVRAYLGKKNSPLFFLDGQKKRLTWVGKVSLRQLVLPVVGNSFQNDHHANRFLVREGILLKCLNFKSKRFRKAIYPNTSHFLVSNYALKPNKTEVALYAICPCFLFLQEFCGGQPLICGGHCPLPDAASPVFPQRVHRLLNARDGTEFHGVRGAPNGVGFGGLSLT